MYLDPLFGSMVVQVIVGAIAVVGAVFFSFRKKLRSLFRKSKGGAEDAAGDAGEAAAEGEGTANATADTAAEGASEGGESTNTTVDIATEGASEGVTDSAPDSAEMEVAPEGETADAPENVADANTPEGTVADSVPEGVVTGSATDDGGAESASADLSGEIPE